MALANVAPAAPVSNAQPGSRSPVYSGGNIVGYTGAQASPGTVQNVQQGAQTPTTTTGASFDPNGGYTPATLNANISNPVNQSQTVQPPAVVTSSQATDDLANKQAQTTQINQDAQTQATAKATPPQTTQNTQSNQKTDSGTTSVDDQISNLLDSLNTNEQQINQQEATDLNPIQQEQQQAQTALDQQAGAALSQLNQIASGTYPLSSAEQSLLSSTTSVYQSTIQAQQQANAAYTGQMTEAMASLGISTSAPTQAMGQIQATISSGNSKISTLDAQMSQSIANLTLGFQKQDYEMAQNSWDETSKYLDDRISTLASMQKQVTDLAEQQKQDIKDQVTTNLTALMDSQTISHQNIQDMLAQATLDEKTKDDLMKNNIAAFTAGMTGLGGGSVGSNLPTATVGADGKVDPASQQAVMNSYTQMYGSQVANEIKGLTDYSVNPADWKAGSTKGMSRATAVALAKALDPTYDDSQYAIRAAYKKSLTSTSTGSLGAAVNSANKSINHLTAFVTAMNKLPNGISSTVNSVDNALTLNQGVRSTISTAKTEGLGVADELAKFFKGTGSTDVASIDDWKSQMSTNASPADVKGLTQGAITLLAGQLETLSEQYQNTMGQAPSTNLLGASAIANLSALKNQGYEVNIPGVLYTDKDAYIKSGPDAQTNINTAITQLQSAGLPLTPENILQLAQSQS